MQGLILAGGEGTRMLRATARLPKPLLYLPGGTLLEHQLALLAQLPIAQIVVVIRHHAERLLRALEGAVHVMPVMQSPPFTLLGALASAGAYLSEPFVVLHGDNLFSHSLNYLIEEAGLAHERSRAEAVFLVESGKGSGDPAERLANTGCYVLPPTVFPLLRDLAKYDELSWLTKASLECEWGVRELTLEGWRANINELRDLLAVSRHLLEDWSGSFHPPGGDAGYNRTGTSCVTEIPLWISPEAEVVDSHIGPLAVVGPRAIVRNCVLREVIVFPGAEIEDLALEDAIVLPDPSGALILAPDDEVDRSQEREDEEEPAELPPSADE